MIYQVWNFALRLSTFTPLLVNADRRSQAALYRITRGSKELIKNNVHVTQIADYYNDHDAELPLPVLNEHETLVASLQTYLTAMDALGVQTWITQSTLVGWNLDQQIPAEDTAVYVQMTESSMKFLANYYNMTLYHYGIRDPARSSEDAMGVVRNYMLEVMAQDTTSENAAEDVRAKWINLDTGLFVSISTLQGSNPRRGRPKALAEYTVEDIFPLHDVVMEKTRCYVPYKYASND